MTAILILQVVGTAAGISGALLTVFKRRGCWAAYMVSNVSFSTLFILKGIYIPILQYAVFGCINVAGWIKWGQDKRKA